MRPWRVHLLGRLGASTDIWVPVLSPFIRRLVELFSPPAFPDCAMRCRLQVADGERPTLPRRRYRALVASRARAGKLYLESLPPAEFGELMHPSKTTAHLEEVRRQPTVDHRLASRPGKGKGKGRPGAGTRGAPEPTHEWRPELGVEAAAAPHVVLRLS
jgi:hypothetical protein